MRLTWFGTENPATMIRGRTTGGDKPPCLPPRLLKDLAQVLPANGLTTSDRALKVHETDGYVARKGRASAIAKPKTTQQVQDILGLCHQHGVPVVPRGSGTSQVGGVVPRDGAVLISMAHMRSVLDFDADHGLIRVQAGIANLQVSKHAEQAGWFYAPNPSSQRTCTIGGNIATNSSGSSFLRYGGTAENLVSASLVLDDGEIVELTGDDPALAMTCGSEGQLGLVTEAQLRLHRIPESRKSLFAGFPTMNAALAFCQSLLAQCRCVSALDMMDRNAVQLTEAFRPSDYPRRARALVLVELSGTMADVDGEAERIESLAEPFHSTERKVSTDTREIWLGRNAIYGAVGREKNFHSLDCAVPLSQLQTHYEQSEQLAREHALQAATVIHCGDGTVHTFLMYDANDPEERHRADLCAGLIRGLAAGMGGSISSEYGIGLRSRDDLALQYSAVSLKQQTAIVQAFSKNRTLNPGKCFPGQSGVPM